ncbi:MAG: hypothetical protein JST36_09745 [Bacteroidetes bacterium]|nr:hypothetical protein [Bacteroidota bacterium]
MPKFLLTIALVFVCWFVQAQPRMYNLQDSHGRPQGEWIVKHPEHMGEEAFSEWGSYDHGKKVGAWYRFDHDGQVTAMEHFSQGQRHGEAKYFENGTLVCVGHFRGLNPRYAFDTILVTDPVTGAEYQRILPTESGSVKHGMWRYYDNVSGRLTRELEYLLGEVIYTHDFSIATVDSAYFKQREAKMQLHQKTYYKPPRDKQFNYTDFR